MFSGGDLDADLAASLRRTAAQLMLTSDLFKLRRWRHLHWIRGQRLSPASFDITLTMFETGVLNCLALVANLGTVRTSLVAYIVS